MVQGAGSAQRTRMCLADGRELISDLESSGLSQRAFAESLGISIGTVQYWRRRVQQSSEFVAVHVVEDPGSDESNPRPWTFELEFGRDRIVRVRSGFIEEELRQVLRVSAEPC